MSTRAHLTDVRRRSTVVNLEGTSSSPSTHLAVTECNLKAGKTAEVSPTPRQLHIGKNDTWTSLIRNIDCDDLYFTKEEIDTTVEEIRICAFRPTMTPEKDDGEMALVVPSILSTMDRTHFNTLLKASGRLVYSHTYPKSSSDICPCQLLSEDVQREIAIAIVTDTDLLDLVTGTSQALEEHRLREHRSANTGWAEASSTSGWMRDSWLCLSRICSDTYDTFRTTLLPYLQNRLSVLGDRIVEILGHLDREDVQKIEGVALQAGNAFGFSSSAKVTIAAAFILLNMIHKRAQK